MAVALIHYIPAPETARRWMMVIDELRWLIGAARPWMLAYFRHSLPYVADGGTWLPGVDWLIHASVNSSAPGTGLPRGGIA